MALRMKPAGDGSLAVTVKEARVEVAAADFV